MTTVRDVILCPPPGNPPENLPKRRLGRQYRKNEDTDILRVTSSVASEGQTSENANGWNRGGRETRSSVASASGVRHPPVRAGAANMIPKVNQTNFNTIFFEVENFFQAGQGCEAQPVSTANVVVKVRLMDQERSVSAESAAIIESLVENRR